MGRRNQILDAIEAFNAAYDTTSRVGKDIELSRLGGVTETQGQTIDQAQIDQINAAQQAAVDAAATDEDRAKISADYKTVLGGINVGDKAATSYGFNGGQYASREAADSANITARAGVLEKYGDTEGAQRLRQQAQQGVLTNLQIKNAQRQDARETKADERTAKIEAVDTDVADWTKKRLTAQDGTTREMTIDDQLAAGQYRVSRLVGSGLLQEANALAKENMGFAKNKIELQTAERNEALGRTAAAIGSGDLEAAKEFYNKYIPDGARVTAVTKDPKTGAITVEREGADGKPLKSQSFKSADELTAGLTMFKDPMALYNFSLSQFHRDLQERQDKRAVNADRRAGAAEGRAQAEFNADAPVREAKQEEAKLRTQLAKTEDPTEQAALSAKIAALRTGTRGAGAAVDPADVRSAAALVASGAYPDQATALEAVISKPDKLHQEYVKAALTQSFGDADKATATANKLMEDSGWARKGNVWTRTGRGGAAGAPAAGPAKGTVVNGYEFQGGDPKDKNNWKKQ